MKPLTRRGLFQSLSAIMAAAIGLPLLKPAPRAVSSVPCYDANGFTGMARLGRVDFLIYPEVGYIKNAGDEDYQRAVEFFRERGGDKERISTWRMCGSDEHVQYRCPSFTPYVGS